MSFEPRNTPEVLGHAQAEAAFLDAWTSGRLAHAWLLSGPKGIGKASLAFRIAKFVLDGGEGVQSGLFGGGPTSLDVPADSPAQRRILAGAHGDLKVIQRGFSDDKQTKRRTEIVVDDVRGIGQFLSLTPAEGGWRVVIIDAADEMNRNAANAVLKVLEEPPRNALLLLVSHSPGRLLPTIRSRCRRLSLAPLSQEVTEDLLGRYRPELRDMERTALARLGEGSIGKSLALADEGGLDLYRDLVGMLSNLQRLDVPALHAFADRVAKADAEATWRTLTELFTWWLARLIRAGAAQAPLQEVVAGEAALMNTLLQSASLDRWLEVWEKTRMLFSRTDAVNLDRKQAMITAFLSLERLARR